VTCGEVFAIMASVWVGVAVVVGLVWYLFKQQFRKGRMPLPAARLWGRVHFAVWRVCLEVSYTFGHRVTPWRDVVDERVWLGKTVLSRHVPSLAQLGITRVLNLQDEYAGPVEAYRQHGIVQKWVPVVDHMEPSPEQLHEAVAFLETALREGRRVYVHCQGGHGRSAAVVFAHLALQDAHMPLRQVNEELQGKWRVRPSLHSQPHLSGYIGARKAKSAL
jgi:hypothetical protein